MSEAGAGSFERAPINHSTNQIETIASFQEVVRLAIVQLAIRDADSSTRSADDFKAITVHHDSCTCIHPNAQQARIRSHNLGEIVFPARRYGVFGLTAGG